jgi:urease accessory protein
VGGEGWRARACLRFEACPATEGATRHQGLATAPLKLQRAFRRRDGRCELPLLHTAGGLVGGDDLAIEAELGPHSRALLTSVAAQKVYGTVGRCRAAPAGRWAEQRLRFRLAEGADLEWFPQELVLYRDGLFRQQARVDLAEGASFLGVEVVRLGRSAAGETLGRGWWQGDLEILRGSERELVDRLALGGAALTEEHGMAGQPVFGSLVWVAPARLDPGAVDTAVDAARAARSGLAGTMACGRLARGLLARYRGASCRDARFWFSRIWAAARTARGLAAPELPRVWPFQESPWEAPAEGAGSA